MQAGVALELTTDQQILTANPVALLEEGATGFLLGKICTPKF
jgi:hypothetical protein